MEPHRFEEPAQPKKDRKVVVQFPEEWISSLRTTCAQKANVSLIGRIQGKHPGHKALTAWARDNLHHSLACLSMKTNNLFEVTFSTPEGRTHALTQTELVCETTYIIFSSWKPHLDNRARQTFNQLDFPVWLQVVDLCQILREEKYLRKIGEQIGQVIAIDNSEAYRTKLYGPRIRLLVQDLETLPQTLVLPRIDEEGEAEYQLEYSGLPHQCGRCRSMDHQVRNCPKKDSRAQKRVHQQQPKTNTTTEQDHPPSIAAQVPTPMPEATQQTVAEDSIADTLEDSAPAAQKEIGLPESPTMETTEAEIKSPETDEGPPNIPAPQQAQATPPDSLPELQPNEVNFPHLNSPGITSKGNSVQSPSTQQPSTPHTFVWRMKTPSEPRTTDKGKEKICSESAPITRQGYRSGRLAEDFWEVLEIPDTPKTLRKKLRVFPLITKNQSQQEYLVDTSKQTLKPITTVHIAEVLAGIPWDQLRARQHVVNEVTQALHSILIFNNQKTTPFQKWSQGRWHSQWSISDEGDHLCTLYVVIPTPENKVRIRKGKEVEWKSLPGKITELLTQTNQGEEVRPAGVVPIKWHELIGQTGPPPRNSTPRSEPPKVFPTAARNPFAALFAEEDRTS
jgi:hypothetical protein